MKSDRQILDSEYNEILLQTVAVIEKSRSMLAVQVSTIFRCHGANSGIRA